MLRLILFREIGILQFYVLYVVLETENIGCYLMLKLWDCQKYIVYACLISSFNKLCNLLEFFHNINSSNITLLSNLCYSELLM